MNHRRVRLMRITIPTDVVRSEPDYPGNFTETFVIDENAQVADVDWSTYGECVVTLIVPAP